MSKPYIICYMMTSIDGRIDCSMTEKLPGVEEYYPILQAFNFDATVSGRVTAQLEIAEKGKFISSDYVMAGKEVVSNKVCRGGCCDVVFDTNGMLLWKNSKEYDADLIVVVSEKTSTEYMAYLEEKGISYIVTGKDKIDIARAVEILYDEFNVKTLGVVGGAIINTAFLDAGLIDEVAILVGAGIDGRASYPTVFSRQNDSFSAFKSLKLIDAKTYETGSVLIRYQAR